MSSPSKKEHKGKKRKSYSIQDIESNKDVEEKKTNKMQKTEPFTEVDFKVALRNSNAIFSGFEKFVTAAEAWPGDAQYDIVEGFLRSSSECSEIFHILEAGKRKVQELQLIFRCFEKILLRIAEDLEKYYTAGQHIVRKLLTTQLPAIYFTLNTKHKSSQIKSALKLLVAMVMLGPTVGKTVLNQIDLNHASIKPLFFRRDSKDEEDVRTCLLHFIVAFLLVGDNELIRRLADTKGFLANVFQGMVYDRVATIQLVLSTFLEKIIMNPVISKTSKVHIFTESSLKQLGQLYNWKGPERWKDADQKKTEADIEESEDIVESEDRQTVAQTVHTVLLELCSSYKYGISFMDKTYGTSGRNQNHMLTSILSYLSNLSHNALVQELIVAILEASPDQLKHFLPHMVHSLSPRATKKWVDAVRFLCKIYEGQPDTPHILKTKDHVAGSRIVDILLVHTLPPTPILNTVLPGVKNKSLPICHSSLGIVKVICQKCVAILQCLSSPDCGLRKIYNGEELSDITTAYKEAVMKRLPTSIEIFQCLDRIQTEGQSQANELAELCQATPSDVMVRIEQVLCLYQELHPTLLLDHPQGMVKLLEGVAVDTDSHLDDNENEAEIENEAGREITVTRLLPQLYLLKLLSGTDARRLPWGKEGQSGHSLMYQLLSMVTMVKQSRRIKEIALQLICKLLTSTGLFDTFTDELYIWMRHLQALVSSGDHGVDLLTFVSKVMMTYMNNPYPYMDRVADLVSEAVAMTTGEVTSRTGKEKLDKKIEEILSMDLGCLEEDGRTDSVVTSELVARRQPFCPLLLVAMDQISVVDNSERTGINIYISSIILDIFHMQTDPKALCLAMKTMPVTMVTPGLHDYLKTWLPPYKIKKPKQSPLSIADKVEGNLMQYFMGSECGKVKVTGLGDLDLTLILKQCLLYVQVLLEQEPTETTTSKLTNILAFLTNVISPEIVRDSPTDSDITLLPTEFSELEVKKPTQNQKLKAIYRIILENPTFQNWFLAPAKDSSGKPRKSAPSAEITNFVKKILLFINDLDLGKCLEEDLIFYVDRILNCVTRHKDSLTENDGVSVELLTQVLKFLDTTKSISVLESVLEKAPLGKSRENSSQDGSLILVTKYIIDSLCLQTMLSIRLTDRCVNNLLKLTCSSDDTDFLQSVIALFKKSPNLAVLCSEGTVIELLQNHTETSLVEILMRNNFKLRTHIEAWLVKKTKWVKENRSKLLLLVEKLLHFHSKKSDIACHLGTVYMADMLTLCQAEASLPKAEVQTLVTVLQHFIRLGVVEKKTLKKLERKLDSVLVSDSPLQIHHIRVIQMIHGCQATGAESHDQDGRQKLLRFCVHGLVKLVKQKDKRNPLVVKKIMEILQEYTKADIEAVASAWDWLIENWPHLLKGCLKYFYTEPGVLRLLTFLLPTLYQTEQEGSSVSIETIVAMVTSHSLFLPVMLNEESPETKEPLLDLLLELLTLRPVCCEKDHVGVYLGSYGATLSISDQKILRLLQLYETSGVELSDFKPFLWGEKAIEHHTLQKSMGDTLLKQPTMVQVLANLQAEKVARTLLHFPLRRKLQSLETQSAVEYKSSPDCYDPCFLIPLFSHLLAPAAIVDCRKFIETGCLGLVFTALSSHDLAMRRAACHLIERYQDHLEGARFMEMDQIKYILDLVKNSMSGSKVKLACIVTAFLSRAVKVMLKPDDHMYGLINIFLLLKPSLDVGNIPEFYKLFNSSALEYKLERQWILSLLHDGLCETADYRIFEKRYTFKLLQSFYDSDLSDNATQLKVLQILTSACHERSIVIDLVRYHSLLTWLLGAVQAVKPEAVGIVSNLVDLMSSLWLTLSEKKSYLPTDNKEYKDTTEVVMEDSEMTKHKSFLVQPTVTSQVLMVLQALLWKVRDVETDALQKLVDTISSVVDHLKHTSTCLKENGNQLPLPVISLVDILLLLLHSLKFIPSWTNSSVLLKLLTNLGYNVSLLRADKGHKVTVKDNAFTKSRDDTETMTTEPDSVNEEKHVEQDSKTGDPDSITGDKLNDKDDAEIVEQEGSQANKVIAADEDKLEIGAKSSNEEMEENSGASIEVVRTYVGKIVSIITQYKPEKDSHSGEYAQTAVIVSVISWCLQQLHNIDDVMVIRSFIEWLNDHCERDRLITQVIASESDLGKDILERLLNVYPKVDSLIVTVGDESGTKTREELLRQLNTILEQVAGLKAKCKPGQLDGDTIEEKSLFLRKCIMQADVRKSGTTMNGTTVSGTTTTDSKTRVTSVTCISDTGKTLKSEDQESSSDERSEIIEYQDFKVTPEMKRYFKDKRVSAQSKSVGGSKKSSKRSNDIALDTSHSVKKKQKQSVDRGINKKGKQ